MKYISNRIPFLLVNSIIYCSIFINLFSCTKQSESNLDEEVHSFGQKSVEPNLNDKVHPFDKKLGALPNVKILEVRPNKLYRLYFLSFKQELDHNNPAAGDFEQRVYLMYRGNENYINEMVTEGYSLDIGSYQTYLHQVTNSNQIYVEFRYYGNSTSKLMDNNYEFLNNTQQIHDYHKVRTELGQILTGKWACSGFSKGGLNALNYKYRYPKDVDLTIAIAPSFSSQKENSKIANFLKDEIATKELREDVLRFQQLALQKKEEVLSLLKSLPQLENMTFDLLGGLSKAYEYAIVYFPLEYWKSYDSNLFSGVPTQVTTTPFEVITALKKTDILNLVSDKALKNDFKLYFYQTQTEIGFYKPNISHLSSLLLETKDPWIHNVFENDTEYNPTNMIELEKWLENEANDIIYIYGEYDPWTSSELKPSLVNNCLKYIIKDKGHYILNFKNLLKEDERIVVEEYIKEKLETDIVYSEFDIFWDYRFSGIN